MRPQHHLGYPRALHPGAWWLWAIGLAAVATRTANPVPLLLVLAVTAFVVAARRSDAPWARSYGAFLRLALVVIAVRVIFQSLLSSASQGPTALVTLPEVPLPEGIGLKLGGVVSAEAVVRACYEGLKLATILVCIGAANALGNPRRLLRSMPAALYEMGVACVIALTFAPQLVTDAQRVREAHRLRGRVSHGLGAVRRLSLPILEGALERSVELAASMDSRGYGRTTYLSPSQRRLTAALTGTGLLGVCVGLFGLLSGTAERWLGAPALLVGAALAALGLAVGGRRSGRTTYRPDPWALPEWLVACCGGAAAGAAFVTSGFYPEQLVLVAPLVTPPVPWLTCAGILLAALPAVVSPPLPGAAPALPAATRAAAPEGAR